MNIVDLLHAQYEKGGRGPDTFDCFGLFLEINKRAGFDVGNYVTPEEYAATEAAIAEGAKTWVKLDGPKPNCAVLFRIGKYAVHLGVVLEDSTRFIHILKGTGVVIESLNHPLWSQRTVGFYEHR